MSSPEAPAAEAVEAAVEMDEATSSLVAVFTESLGDAMVGTHFVPGQDPWIRVVADAWVEAGNVARKRARCTFFDFLSVIDWLPSPFGREMDSQVDQIVHGLEKKDAPEMTSGYAGGDTRFQVFAHVTPPTASPGVVLKVDVPEETLSVDSWVPVYAGANWHEREAWEMYGVDFVGHPYLRHIYLPGAFEGFPGRKDFPLLARRIKPWPGIVDVEPLPGSAGDEEGEE